MLNLTQAHVSLTAPGGGCICAAGSILSPSGTSCTPCGPGQIVASSGTTCISGCVGGLADLTNGGCSTCEAGLVKVQLDNLLYVCVEACVNVGNLVNVQGKSLLF